LEAMKYLVLAVHDATPAYLKNLKEISGWFDRNSLQPRCIKVIPNFLGRWSILDSQEFLDWLYEEKEKGSEIIQHGYIHYQPNREAKGLDTIRRKLLTKDEAEFIGLDYQQARKAIAKGKEILEKAGFEPLGFTSPTWQQSKPTIKAIKDCGFRYYTTLSGLWPCQSRRRLFSVAMGFQGVNLTLEIINAAGNRVMQKTGLSCSPLARLVIHPPFISGQRLIIKSLRASLKLSKRRKLVTYNQYLDLAEDE